MSTLVELRVFSGIENPQWTLTDAQAGEFQRWLNPVPPGTPGPLGPPVIDPAKLPRVGYTGFIVTVDQQKPHRVYADALVRPLGAPAPHKTMDEWLFATYSEQLFDEYGLLPDILERQAPRRIRGLPNPCPTASLHCGSTAFPPRLNTFNDEPHQSNLACYNYASDILSRLRLFPETPYPHSGLWRPIDVQNALTADLLRARRRRVPTACPVDSHFHYIAALLHTLGTAGDYHFLRLDHDGCWSHKNGADDATNRDDLNQTLGDLGRAMFATDYLFAGFFEMTEAAHQRLMRRGGGPP